MSEPRRGEICNACVLLVKRFKKLPVSSGRHWGHVVDARAGPGVKNFVRERRRESCRERSFKKKHVYRRKPASSETESDAEPAVTGIKIPVSLNEPLVNEPRVSDFIDLNIFKKKKVCCGVIFVGPCGEAIVDPRFLTKCSAHAPPVTLPKIDNPLFTIEKIIESELKTFASTSSGTGSGEESKPVSPVCRKHVSRSPSGQGGEETDEGFYDKPSISPTNSID